MTRYKEFDELKELTKLTKTERGYSKFIQKGDIEFYDYGVGFFDVDVYAYTDVNGNNWVRIWFGTVDDGDYGGWKNASNEEEAARVVDEISTNVFKDMVSLPCIKELNEMLEPYGVDVGYE